jgi:hypothetical protein
MLPIENLTYLVGSESISTRPLMPYAPVICDFLDDLSLELRSQPQGSGYPDVLAFAAWCRRANISRLRELFEAGNPRLGLGLVFHIAPANVPINFAFSYVLGLLAGNANVVRVPSKPFPQIEIICSAINKVLADDKYADIKQMTAFVRYEAQDAITADISSLCRARLIWGGDQTVQNIRRLPLPARSSELTFADRYSFCVIEAPAVIALGDAALMDLADGFYNDTFLMDQGACSSPHLVVWRGEGRDLAKARFWEALRITAARRYDLQTSHATQKYVHLCQDAVELESFKEFEKHGNYIYRIALTHLDERTDNLRGKFGYFYEYDVRELAELVPIVSTKYQTLTYFGLEKQIILDWILQNRLAGIDRVVPIGKALDFDVVWDGVDIVQSLSRVIEVS